jgi:hypothetical protein
MHGTLFRFKSAHKHTPCIHELVVGMHNLTHACKQCFLFLSITSSTSIGVGPQVTGMGCFVFTCCLPDIPSIRTTGKPFPMETRAREKQNEQNLILRQVRTHLLYLYYHAVLHRNAPQRQLHLQLHCHFTWDVAPRCTAPQRNATQRNATQLNATQRNATATAPAPANAILPGSGTTLHCTATQRNCNCTCNCTAILPPSSTRTYVTISVGIPLTLASTLWETIITQLAVRTRLRRQLKSSQMPP